MCLIIILPNFCVCRKNKCVMCCEMCSESKISVFMNVRVCQVKLCFINVILVHLHLKPTAHEIYLLSKKSLVIMALYKQAPQCSARF